jgi:hypothetical protein
MGHSASFRQRKAPISTCRSWSALLLVCRIRMVCRIRCWIEQLMRGAVHLIPVGAFHVAEKSPSRQLAGTFDGRRFFGQVGGHVTPRQQVQPACVMPRHCALAITDHLARILALPSASPDFWVGRWYQLRRQRTPRNFPPALDNENQAQRKSWINIAVWAVLPRVQRSRPSRDHAK